MAEASGAGSPYEGAPTITYPTEGMNITSETYDLKGMAPAGSTVYLMEYMRGVGEKEGPGDKEWQYPISTKAAADNTFVIDQLSGGTGFGDSITHRVFVNVNGKPQGIKIIGGTESAVVQFTHPPKER